MRAAHSLNSDDVLSLRLHETGEKNFGLSEEDFAELLRLLGKGDHRLFERIFLTQFKEAVNYLKRRDGASQEDAHDAVMATLLRFRELLLRKKIHYGNLRYLFTRMARQQYQRSQQRQSIFSQNGEPTPDLIDESDHSFDEEAHELLLRAFRSLGKECRELLRDFYHRHRSLKELAEESDRSAPAVRKQKSRCVATLRDYFYRIS